MKIAIIGSRGIPAKYGGFETFAFHISKILLQAGHDVTVVNEHDNSVGLQKIDGVNIIESRFKKSKNPLLFYFNSLRKTADSFDLIFVCGVGASLFYPLLKKKSSYILTNVDGLEHRRAKFSLFKKIFVRLSQFFADRFSDFIIADSEAIGKYWHENISTKHEKLQVITYGAEATQAYNSSALENYKLSKGDYYLILARLVPENHIHLIIQGYLLSGSTKKLFIIGGKEKSDYVNGLLQSESDKIIFPGAIYSKETLDSIRIGAYAYLHGHSVGGTNPSLLEAMAASCVCICHDNVFNREVNSEEQLYFRNAEELSRRMKEIESMSFSDIQLMKDAALNRVTANYSWKKIGDQYIELLNGIYERTNRL